VTLRIGTIQVRKLAPPRVAASVMLSLFLGLGVPGCLGQRPLAAHDIEWKTQELPDGRVRVEVTNTSRVPITGIVAEGERASSGSGHIQHSIKSVDTVLEPHSQDSIKSGETYSLDFFGPTSAPNPPTTRTVTVRAVLFEDGGSWGEQQWIDNLTSARKTAYECESEILQTLLSAKINPSDSTSVFQELDLRRKDDLAKAQNIFEKKIIGAIFEEVRLKILVSNQTSAFRDANTLLTPKAVSGQSLDSAIDSLSLRIHSLEVAQRAATM